jgi:hypothetical protein
MVNHNHQQERNNAKLPSLRNHDPHRKARGSAKHPNLHPAQQRNEPDRVHDRHSLQRVCTGPHGRPRKQRGPQTSLPSQQTPQITTGAGKPAPNFRRTDDIPKSRRRAKHRGLLSMRAQKHKQRQANQLRPSNNQQTTTNLLQRMPKDNRKISHQRPHLPRMQRRPRKQNHPQRTLPLHKQQPRTRWKSLRMANPQRLCRQPLGEQDGKTRKTSHFESGIPWDLYAPRSNSLRPTKNTERSRHTRHTCNNPRTQKSQKLIRQGRYQ